jgi:hypothetical protein
LGNCQREYNNFSHYELKKQKPWLDEACAELLNQGKEANLQLLQNQSEICGDNLKTRHEASRHFRNKKREYLKEKINELAMNSKNKNIRQTCIEEFKRGYQPTSNLMKDEIGDLLAVSCNIFNKSMNHFSQLLTVHRVSAVRQTEIHTAEPLVPDPSPEIEFSIAKLKRYKLPGSDQIPAELIQVGGETLQSEIHKLINSIWNKNCLINGRSLLLYQFTRRAIKLTVVIIAGYHCYQLHTKFYLISFSQG